MAAPDTPSTTAALAPSLARVARGNLCAGCGGCALAAPGKVEMRLTAPGYLRPHQTAPLSTQEDDRIARICPGLGQTVDPGERLNDPLWGPYLSMQTGFATDAGLRFAASSGGGLSAVLVHLLDSGDVDGVIQTAASPAVPVANVTVISETAAQVAQAAGSRYAPSAPLAGLEVQLQSDKRYVFVGKPCDVAALRALEAENPRISARIPIMVSFFCAGVPSQSGAEEVLETLGTNLAETRAFRYRGQGWPGRATATLQDGSERSMTYHESWGGVLSRHTQLRCKICADGTGKAADLVFADAWESDADGYPVFDEQDGISLIVARTETGAAVLEAAHRAGQIETAPFETATLAAIQPGQRGRREVLIARLAGLMCLWRPIPRYRGLGLRSAARSAAPRRLAKDFLGIFYRALKGRL